MQKQEFVKETGIEVNDVEYEIIEAIYMNMPSVVVGYTTTQFCEWVKIHNLTRDLLINVIGPIAGAFVDRADVLEKRVKEIGELTEERDLNAMAFEDLKRRYDTVVELIGADRIREAVTASMDLDTLVDLRARRGC